MVVALSCRCGIGAVSLWYCREATEKWYRCGITVGIAVVSLWTATENVVSLWYHCGIAMVSLWTATEATKNRRAIGLALVSLWYRCGIAVSGDGKVRRPVLVMKERM